jgi:hypothetical protein
LKTSLLFIVITPSQTVFQSSLVNIDDVMLGASGTLLSYWYKPLKISVVISATSLTHKA